MKAELAKVQAQLAAEKEKTNRPHNQIHVQKTGKGGDPQPTPRDPINMAGQAEVQAVVQAVAGAPGPTTTQTTLDPIASQTVQVAAVEQKKTTTLPGTPTEEGEGETVMNLLPRQSFPLVDDGRMFSHPFCEIGR